MAVTDAYDVALILPLLGAVAYARFATPIRTGIASVICLAIGVAAWFGVGRKKVSTSQPTFRGGDTVRIRATGEKVKVTRIR